MAVSGAAALAPAQSPILPNPNRAVHPGIAPTALALQPAPLFAVPDGEWNHAEGFAPSGTSDADFGGWFRNDNGTELDIADVHSYQNPPTGSVWTQFNWSSPFWNSGGNATFLRFGGYLRPASAAPLPTQHPIYGLVSPYVDQGAFEVFLPNVPPTASQKIVICVMTWETRGFPRDVTFTRRQWRQVYPGIFSPDGLERDEKAPRSSGSFQLNTSIANGGVYRPKLQILASWNPILNASYWPIVAYPVVPVMHRQTTLNEQRYLQVAQAIKLMLREPLTVGSLNPMAAYSPAPAPLSQAQVAARCVVCFAGGSNGGMSSTLAALRYPHLVHGAFAEVINPSYQRLYSELDFAAAVAMSSGQRTGTLRPDDYMHWDQYAWSQSLEMHDLSYLRQFLAGKAYRSALVAVGDEDVTSTGTDWARVISTTGAWEDHGITSAPPNPLPGGYVPPNMAFGVAENSCHQHSAAPVTPPTGGPVTYNSIELAHWVLEAASAQRAAEITGNVPTPPIPAVTHTPRASQNRGLDDPHEWFLERHSEDLPASASTFLTRDDAFFAASQPGATGAMPGLGEAMLIRDNKVYVGSADGFVSCFDVDPTNPRQPLRRVAQSRRLGQGPLTMTALANGPTWTLLVGTRRHLHLLEPYNLAPACAQPVQLPWEVSQPHHVQVANVLPGHAGLEVVFASKHGGLVFFDTSLNPIHEWPEPGIVDFVTRGSTVTILSSRGMIASVTFDNLHQPTLVAASRPLPPSGAWQDPMQATQGIPGELELMRFDLSMFGLVDTGLVSTWTGDIDGGVAIRVHDQHVHWRAPLSPNATGLWIDLATCRQEAGYYGGSPDVGDHLLALGSDGTLALIDQLGIKVAQKNLTTTAQGYWPFGADPIGICVGELVTNSGQYEQEIVVATKTGLMWLHVNDLLTPGTALAAASGPPASGYWMDVARTNGVGTEVQPRTNRTLSAAWAIARRPGDGKLHVLDQRGCYWKVGSNGSVALWERERSASGKKGWEYFGNVTGRTSGFSGSIPSLGGVAYVDVGALQAGHLLTTTPWATINGGDAIYQFASPSYPAPDNWGRWDAAKCVFDQFFCFSTAGSSLATSATNSEAWLWSEAQFAPLLEWGNLLEGVSVTNGTVDGGWASVAEPASLSPSAPLVGTNCNHLRLRSFTQDIPAMSQQAIKAIRLPGSSDTLLVVGCPGGRVRIVDPGQWRTGDNAPQGMGSVLASSSDLGFGGGAMAVKVEPTGTVRIWFGTSAHPAKRPIAYSGNGALADDEVAHGAIHVLSWNQGASTVALQQSVTLAPTLADPNGGYCVTGMRLANLLSAPTGDELVVTTMAGDVFVYAAATMQRLDRTRVLGSAGFYNSILVEDLDSDGVQELYVAGALGLWRFTQSGE